MIIGSSLMGFTLVIADLKETAEATFQKHHGIHHNWDKDSSEEDTSKAATTAR